MLPSKKQETELVTSFSLKVCMAYSMDVDRLDVQRTYSHGVAHDPQLALTFNDRACWIIYSIHFHELSISYFTT